MGAGYEKVRSGRFKSRGNILVIVVFKWYFNCLSKKSFGYFDISIIVEIIFDARCKDLLWQSLDIFTYSTPFLTKSTNIRITR